MPSQSRVIKVWMGKQTGLGRSGSMENKQQQAKYKVHLGGAHRWNARANEIK